MVSCISCLQTVYQSPFLPQIFIKSNLSKGIMKSQREIHTNTRKWQKYDINRKTVKYIYIFRNTTYNKKKFTKVLTICFWVFLIYSSEFSKLLIISMVCFYKEEKNTKNLGIKPAFPLTIWTICSEKKWPLSGEEDVAACSGGSLR